jgi:hypothetical protein
MNDNSSRGECVCSTKNSVPTTLCFVRKMEGTMQIDRRQLDAAGAHHRSVPAGPGNPTPSRA